MRGLKDKVGIVAGAGRGIGAATVRRLAAEGAAVVVGDIREAEARSVADEINNAGGRALAVAMDITDEKSVAELVQKAVSAFGGLDFFHANAAGGTEGDVDALNCPLEVFDKSVAINMRSHLICTQQALPALLERGGGAMVYTSSGAAYGVAPWQVAYPMAKNGLHALMRHVAARWGKENIRANVVAPGVVLTEAVREHLTDEYVEQALARVPSTRLGQPDDIAGMVAFLVSDDGQWINGQVFSVNGGAAMRD